MKKMIKDVFLKLTFKILKICITFTMIYLFFLKKKTDEIENLVANLHNKNSYANIYLHKKYKTGIKSWISFKKS